MPTDQLEQVLLCPNLPSLPVVAMEVLELTSDPDVPIKVIAQVVQRDQALAAKVLKTVNSSFYGLSKRCASIDRAMAYLGMNTVKSLVLGFSLVDVAKVTEGTEFDLMAHWRRAILGATASRTIAEQTGSCDPDEAFTAGLFQDIGVLACFAALKRRYTDVVQGNPHGEWAALERGELGFDHIEVGSLLAKKWKLPEEVIQGVIGHHDPKKATPEGQEMARTVAMGSEVAGVLGEPLPPGAVRNITRLGDEWFGDRAPHARALLEAVTDDAKTLAKMFDQDIGKLRDPSMLLAEASERGMEHQIQVQRENESFAKEATTDGLTGLANRKRFDRAFAEAGQRFSAEGVHCAVLFIDADRFKSVNDKHGHAAGDAVLMELARRITGCVQHDGLVCRYGGEEIAIVLPEMGLSEASVLGEAIRAAIDAEPFMLGHIEGAPEQLRVTVSVGVAATDGDDATRYAEFKTLLSDADACVYEAKSAGRNRVFVHRPKRHEEALQEGVPAPAGELEIVLIEDDPLAATLISTLLKRKGGVRVRWIESGTRAKAELFDGGAPERMPDVFLVDLNLPGVSGYDLLELTRGSASMSGVPFYVLSAEDAEKSRDESLRRGATDFIPKQDFVQNIGSWLERILSVSSQSKAA